MTDQEPSRESCSSPRPMAFTVDFGPPAAEKDHRKLALRDNIGRFAPKFKNRVAQQQANNKDHNGKEEVILVDEENNIANAKGQRTAAGRDNGVEEDASDAGTYTIDDEEEEEEEEPKKELTNNKSLRAEEIQRAFGVPEEKVCSRSDWVSAWAASNSFASDNPIQEEDLEPLTVTGPEDERSSSGQRRRLPPTPQRQQQNGYPNQVYTQRTILLKPIILKENEFLA